MTKTTSFQAFYRKLTPTEKIELAKRARTSVNYLSQVANGHRTAGLDLYYRLNQADDRITLKMLRPDLRHDPHELACDAESFDSCS